MDDSTRVSRERGLWVSRVHPQARTSNGSHREASWKSPIWVTPRPASPLVARELAPGFCRDGGCVFAVVAAATAARVATAAGWYSVHTSPLSPGRP
eukprot:scaffold26137_cov82-Phaeocystis_antarctica.AAC.1